MPFVAGVDCHKSTHSIVVLDVTGVTMLELEIAATPEDYQRAITAAKAFDSVIWGLEGTGCYGRAFAQALRAAGFDVYEVPGNFTKRHRRAASRHGKSDRNDAHAIAEAVLRERDRLPKFEEFEVQEALRLRYEQRDRLVRERTALLNRVQSAALRLGIDLPGKLKTTRNIAVLQATLAAMTPADLVQEALLEDIGFDLVSIERLNREILRLEGMMRPFVNRLAPELLAMTGVSVVVAAGLIGCTGNLANLRNADAFAMRSATAPISWSSGKNQNVRLNTGGDRQLNRLLYIIATVQKRTVGHAGYVYYNRKRAEGKTKRAALRTLKRQLAKVVYYRLRLSQTRVQGFNLTAAA